jgi:hypothetical protein
MGRGAGHGVAKCGALGHLSPLCMCSNSRAHKHGGCGCTVVTWANIVVSVCDCFPKNVYACVAVLMLPSCHLPFLSGHLHDLCASRQPCIFFLSATTLLMHALAAATFTQTHAATIRRRVGNPWCYACCQTRAVGAVRTSRVFVND